jgi:hypothetical protein
LGQSPKITYALTGCGLKLGEERGLRRGEMTVLLRLLTRKFGPIPPALHDQITNLSQEKLEQLADAVLDFAVLDQLHTWLAR